MSTSAYDQVLSCQALPTLPTIAVQLLELTRKPNVSLAEIGQLVKGDVGLSAKVLKTVNSSFFGLKTPCSTIDRALAYLGLNTVKSLVLGFSLVDCTKSVKDGGGFDLNMYWRRAIYAGSASRILAEATRAADPDEAFTAALFQDMGMMASYVALGGVYTNVLRETPDHDRLPAAEMKALNFTHASIGAELARKWRMQDQLVECIAWHHDPDGANEKWRALVRCIALGRIAAETMMNDTPGGAVAQLFARGREWFDASQADLGALMERITLAARDLARVFEKDLGTPPDVPRILASANEQLLEHRICAEREAAELREAQQKLVAKTLTDALTGANNRSCFDTELSRMFAESRAGGGPLAVLFSDADKFKSVNDTHGHQAGDAVLIGLSRRIREVIGELGIVCRYGGEEFAVLLPDTDVKKAARLAERVRKAVEDSPFEMAGVDGAPPSLKVTISVGVSATDLAGAPPATAEQLVHQADQGVYAAKREGRNCVRVFSSCTEAASQVAPPIAVASAAKQSGPRVSVLLIEDDALAAALLQATLRRREGTDVTWVRSATDASALLSRIDAGTAPTPTVIICDLQLPDRPGTEVIQAVRRSNRCKGLPVMVVSSSEARDDVTHAVKAGADVYLTKIEVAQHLARWVTQVVELSTRGLSAQAA